MKFIPPPLRLSATEDELEYQVVQPDITVICDGNKLDDKGCNGAPELIIEVLSPPTCQKDRIEKMNLYQKHGVKEYLLIYPNERVVEQYVLTEEDLYGTPIIYKEEEDLRSLVLEEFEVSMIDLFS